MLKELYQLGTTSPKNVKAKLVPAPLDMILPENFYSTTNHPSAVFTDGRWVEVEGLMMDKQIVVDPSKKKAYCKPIRQVKKGNLVVVGELGIRIKPPERPREGLSIFEFMTSRASSEKPSASILKTIAEDLHKANENNQKIVAVAGPAIIHTGAAPSLARMIKLGYVNALLSGNALAVYDIEFALYGTSLGMNLITGTTTRGNRNHLAAVNEVMKAGSLKALVEKKILTKGIFYECITNKIPFLLAGSIRDDGPILDVITDTIEGSEKIY